MDFQQARERAWDRLYAVAGDRLPGYERRRVELVDWRESFLTGQGDEAEFVQDRFYLLPVDVWQRLRDEPGQGVEAEDERGVVRVSALVDDRGEQDTDHLLWLAFAVERVGFGRAQFGL